MVENGAATWQETDSAHFVDRGRIYTPDREAIARMVVDLIPADADDSFLGVEIGAGQGWMTDAILQQYPRARMIAVDGSATMRAAAKALLAPHAGRYELRSFRLEDDRWLDDLDGPIRCFVSCLVIHHLDGPGKRALFAKLAARLEPGGALLIADIMEPTSAWGRRAISRAYNETVRRQSLAFTGTTEIYDQFRADHWNIFDYPDPDFDKPSTVPEHLRWLEEAGLTGVDLFWAQAGHALVGGYKP